MRKRKICFVITSQVHYGRSKLILSELKKRKDVELQIVIGASALLSNYGDVLTMIKKDGFKVDASALMTLEGGNPTAAAKTTGVGILEFATIFENLKPDVAVVRGDRYEVLAAAIAAAYLNIPVAHIEGGDVTGNIDESVRHAITKLSHIHFTTNEESKKRVLRMGENPKYVFDFGCPGVEYFGKASSIPSNKFINSHGVGSQIDLKKPYLLVMQHPVTSEVGENRKHLTETLMAVNNLGIQTIWFWPNIDAGTDEVSKSIRVFRENVKPDKMHFLKYLEPSKFIGLLKKASCLVGNSSTGIKECSYLGVPAVNIGTRQNGRMRAENIIDVGYDRTEIKEVIKKQLKHGKYKRSEMYYQKGANKNIAEVLAKIPLYVQKHFCD